MQPQLIPGGAEKFRASEAYLKVKGKIYNIDELMQETGALIAGGGVLSTISPQPWLSNDLDIYVPCRTLPALLVPFRRAFAAPRYRNYFKASEYCPSFLRRNGIRCVQTLGGVDIMSVRHKTTPLNVVQNFDLTVCQVWYDGKDVYATHPDHIATMKATLQGDYVPVFCLGNRFLQKRIEKYNYRGYEIKIDNMVLQSNSYLSTKYSVNAEPRMCTRHGTLKESEKGKTWARKYLFYIAVGTEENNLAKRRWDTEYLKKEEGYDSEDYIDDPNRILEIKQKEYINEKGYEFLEKLEDPDINNNNNNNFVPREVRENQMGGQKGGFQYDQHFNPNWNTDYLIPFKAELEALVGPYGEVPKSAWKGFSK
jgi:hypothetical protein